jgi:hypothetical protein
MNIPEHSHPPDKGEVGGSSPPRPTNKVQINSLNRSGNAANRVAVRAAIPAT